MAHQIMLNLWIQRTTQLDINKQRLLRCTFAVHLKTFLTSSTEQYFPRAVDSYFGQEIPCSYESWRFITMFTKGFHWILCWVNSISTNRHFSWGSYLNNNSSDEISKVCSMHWWTEKCINIYVVKPERKRWLGWTRHRWKDNIETDLWKIGWEYVNWIHLALDQNQWLALVNFQVP
jgi:hypothetical protein